MNYERLNRDARREALKNVVPFTWYQREGKVKHNSAIVQAIASNRKFSYIK
jgi:hypothetical protein